MSEADVERSFLLGRSDVFHAAMLLIGVVTVLQSIVFSNAVLAGAPIYCRIASVEARYGVYAFLALFWGAYQGAIELCGGLERDYRRAAGVDVDQLAARTKRMASGMNAVSAVFTIGAYSAALFLTPTEQLCT